MKKLNKLPLVSIVIPVYNGSLFLWQTILSIYKSKYKNFEVILVDDGSTDSSKELCQEIDKKYKKIRFYSFSKNKGMTRVLNFGIWKAKGKYIARINQDDLMMAKRLEKQTRFLEENPGHVAVGGSIILFTGNNLQCDKINFPLSNESIRKQWLRLSPFSDPTVMFRKKAFLKTRGYSQKIWPADDVHMWYQLGKLGKLANLAQVMTRVRWHKEAGSIKKHRLQMKKTWEIHMWAKENVSSPGWFTWVFWLGEFLAGFFLPAEFNWYIYRQIRKIQKMDLLGRLIKIKNWFKENISNYKTFSFKFVK